MDFFFTYTFWCVKITLSLICTNVPFYVDWKSPPRPANWRLLSNITHATKDFQFSRVNRDQFLCFEQVWLFCSNNHRGSHTCANAWVLGSNLFLVLKQPEKLVLLLLKKVTSLGGKFQQMLKSPFYNLGVQDMFDQSSVYTENKCQISLKSLNVKSKNDLFHPLLWEISLFWCYYSHKIIFIHSFSIQTWNGPSFKTYDFFLHLVFQCSSVIIFFSCKKLIPVKFTTVSVKSSLEDKVEFLYFAQETALLPRKVTASIFLCGRGSAVCGHSSYFPQQTEQDIKPFPCLGCVGRTRWLKNILRLDTGKCRSPWIERSQSMLLSEASWHFGEHNREEET